MVWLFSPDFLCSLYFSSPESYFDCPIVGKVNCLFSFQDSFLNRNDPSTSCTAPVRMNLHQRLVCSLSVHGLQLYPQFLLRCQNKIIVNSEKNYDQLLQRTLQFHCQVNKRYTVTRDTSYTILILLYKYLKHNQAKGTFERSYNLYVHFMQLANLTPSFHSSKNAFI